MGNWMNVMVETAILIVEDVRDAWVSCCAAQRETARQRTAWFREDLEPQPGGVQQGQ